MARCENCQKFVSLEPGDPEPDVEVDNVDGNGAVTGNVRISLTCADCSQEMKEATLDVDLSVELKHAEGCEGEKDLDLEFEVSSCDKYEPPKAKRQAHYWGAEGVATVSCPCGAEGKVEWVGYVKSSEMDEI